MVGVNDEDAYFFMKRSLDQTIERCTQHKRVGFGLRHITRDGLREYRERGLFRGVGDRARLVGSQTIDSTSAPDMSPQFNDLRTLLDYD